MSIRAIPIRARLVLGFVLVMATILTATGAIVYDLTRSDLDQQIERELSARLAGVIAIVRDDGDDLGDPAMAPLDRVDAEGAVQVLGPSGDVVDATAAQLRDVPLLSESEIDEIARVEGAHADLQVGGGIGALRVVADRTQDDGVQYTILVAASLDERDQALSSLSRLLVIGGPIALLFASLAAYWVATAALRPVEAIRSRAAEISEHEPGQRLPVSAADDEIAHLGATLNAMLDRLEAALARERRFVADASHELRTPLSILKAEVQLALGKGRSPDELREALLSVGEETDRLARLAEDLLVIARADEGHLPVEPERVGVAGLADRVAARYTAGSPDAAARIELAVPPGIEVHGDPLRLEQAISNLVDNALRYGRGIVTVSATATDGRVAIHVTDHGDGFPPNLVGRAFERFARADGARAGGGAGLGLSIVEAIATSHGGEAGAENLPSGGAHAWIVLTAL